jgi:urease accessory protein
MTPRDEGLLALLQLCDTLFPIGSFAHSDGLEAATASGAIRSGDDLRGWLHAQLSGLLRSCDGPAVVAAVRHANAGRWDELTVLDEELYALRPSSAARQALRAMGTRLLKTWRAMRSAADIDAFLLHRGARGATLPVAFGLACASANVEPRPAVEAFLYTRLAGTVSASMRLIPIGQIEAHVLLAGLLAHVTATADVILESDEPPSSFAPALDIAAMSHQYVDSRLFRS